jgi:hypothetical protein
MDAVDKGQPWVDHWPMWDEGLSKFPAPFDIATARGKLARKFNTRLRPRQELPEAQAQLAQFRKRDSVSGRYRQPSTPDTTDGG